MREGISGIYGVTDRRGLQVSERLRAEGVSPQQLTRPCEVLKIIFFSLVCPVGKYIHICFNHVMDWRRAIFFVFFFHQPYFLADLDLLAAY